MIESSRQQFFLSIGRGGREHREHFRVRGALSLTHGCHQSFTTHIRHLKVDEHDIIGLAPEVIQGRFSGPNTIELNTTAGQRVFDRGLQY